jgi:PUA domain protein
MDVSSRHHLRSDQIDALTDSLAEQLGVSVGAETFELVELEETPFDLVLLDGEPAVFRLDGEWFLTVRGANATAPDRHVVTVDAGAVEFVSNGADVMRPGIVEADPDVAAGDLVVVAEETHGKVLAVGRALVDGPEMVGDSGKVVESVHHVGDEFYDVSV